MIKIQECGLNDIIKYTTKYGDLRVGKITGIEKVGNDYSITLIHYESIRQLYSEIRIDKIVTKGNKQENIINHDRLSDTSELYYVLCR
jgi:hypothetical protein